MAADDTDPRYSALLIGSWEGDRSRQNRGNSNKRLDTKGGIKRPGFKYKNESVPADQWAEGDLDKMEELMKKKKIGVFDRLAYVEQDEDGHYAKGRDDILTLVDDFFKQEGKTHFVLYFTGHGAITDGSWCFAVREPIPERSCSHGSAHMEENSWVSGTSGASSIGIARSSGSTVPSNKRVNDFVDYQDIIKKWDDNNPQGGTEERFLMMILDCCHAGKWVQMLNSAIDSGETVTAAATSEQEQVRSKRRDNICIQAACGTLEKSTVASNQQSSVFTRDFVAAQKRSTSENLFRTAVDYLFLNIPMPLSSFTPISSKNAPTEFCGMKFYDSFDDMIVQT